jgi:hypothetical protein
MLLFKGALTLGCFFICSFVHAQDSTKPSPRITFRNLSNPDSIALINFKIIPIPIVTSSPETGVRYGGALEYFFNSKEGKSEARGSYVHGQITYSTKNQFEISGAWQIFGKGEKYVFRGSTGFTTFSERYWGLGNNTLANNDYYSQFYNRTFLESRNYRLIGNQWYAGLALNYSNTYGVTYSKPLSMQEQNTLGIYGSTVFGVGPAVLYEARNYPFGATKGSYLEFYYQPHAKILGADYAFSEWMLDIRKYFPIAQEGTLAFQFMTRNTNGDVPLREIPRMGNGSLLRGFFTGRFRDKSYTAAQAELRGKIWKWVYGALFAGTGLVDESISRYDIANFRFAGGAGLRLLVNKKNRMFIRVDYARNSTGGSAYYIKLNEAF